MTRQIKCRVSGYLLLAFVLALIIFSAQLVLAQSSPHNNIYLPVIFKDSGASPVPPNPGPGAGPSIGTPTTNLSEYPNGQVPRYEKLELSFAVNTTAKNPQMPYDTSPPPGIEPEFGISVDALFSPDNWQTIYSQPAFYFQDFTHAVKDGSDWLYPTNSFLWKVRFAPNQPGTWQYKLVAQDAQGQVETTPQSFEVVTSLNKGFIRVSQTDSRYFEYEDGTYFPALGYNMNYDHVSWINPIQDNAEHFQKMSQNGIQLVRVWLSQWAIYGTEWNPWNAQNPDRHGGYLPHTGITFADAPAESEVTMKVEWDYSPCMYIGDWKARPAVKRNKDYRVRIRYKATDISGPRISGQPFGFVAKTGPWLWGDNNYCYDPGVGTVVTPHQAQNTADWQILEGTLTTDPNSDFLDNFFLVLENVNSGTVYVDYVWIEEDLGNGQYGPNIVSKPWMAHHLYMEQRNSYAFDQVLELAEQNDVYLRPVLHEKSDTIFNQIDHEGQPIPENPLCWDDDTSNDPEKCYGNDWFYGNRREMTKARWLEQAWWRYVQARWGYATHIHSWELLNEGDPWNELHYVLADEFGKYMHQFKPNDHLVSTSNWNSFPKDQFWANSSYQNVDFADFHSYVPESDPLFADAAQASYDVSLQYGAAQPGGAGKPVIRGETGFTKEGTEPGTDQLQNDTQGIWLHNFVWAGINAGGLIESYWYENSHIYSQNENGSYAFDHRSQYRTFYNFISDIPLSNGHYQAAQATVSNNNLRAWGQKDLVNGQAHLWVQNKDHTWRNVVDGASIPARSGTVEMIGFQPNQSYTVEWWDPYQTDKAQQVTGSETIVAQGNGVLVIPVSNLTTDVALKIIPN